MLWHCFQNDVCEELTLGSFILLDAITSSGNCFLQMNISLTFKIVKHGSEFEIMWTNEETCEKRKKTTANLLLPFIQSHSTGTAQL